jgi:CubicO group peptidase (beta-lactamase class C family)
MNRRTFIRSAGLAVLAACSRLAPVASAEERAPKDLSDLLERTRKDHRLPGMAAAVVRGDQIAAEGVAGVRRVGTDDKITLDDRFAIGSCTKRMTAVMIGRVIDSGKLSFETTLADALPDVEMRDDYRKVTIAQLLSFTGGIQPYTQIGPKLTPILFELTGSAAEQQEQFVRHVLQEEPVVKPGTERKYSNASYVVAVFAASRKTGRGWEALMEEEVFKPLPLTKAGFGRPRSKERPHEPWLHRKGDQGYEPEPKEPQAEPAAALAGAGGVHCSIRDFARFAAYELAAARGKDALRQPATAKRWQELSQGETSEGRPVFGGTPWLTAGYVLWPSKNLAAAVTLNGGSAADACKAVFKAVEDRYGGSDK